MILPSNLLFLNCSILVSKFCHQKSKLPYPYTSIQLFVCCYCFLSLFVCLLFVCLLVFCVFVVVVVVVVPFFSYIILKNLYVTRPGGYENRKVQK